MKIVTEDGFECEVLGLNAFGQGVEYKIVSGGKYVPVIEFLGDTKGQTLKEAIEILRKKL